MQDNTQENTSTGASPEPTSPEAVVVTTENTTVVLPTETQAEPVTVVETVAPVVTEVETVSVEGEAVAQTIPPTAAAKANTARALKQYGIAGVIVLFMGVGLLYVLEEQGRVHTGVFATVKELVKPAPAAAAVNGVKIPLATYEKNRAQIEKNALSQGLTVTDEAVKTEINKQAIDVLVNTELLKQAAAKAKISVTQEQIDTRYGEIVKSLGGEEALKTKMLELGITEESLQSDIKGEILIQGYLSQAVDLTKIVIEEKDMQKVYDQANTPEAKLPPFAEVKADIEAQLKSTKEQELVNAHIETLRTDAKIETKV